MIRLTAVHVPDGREKELGTFPFVQTTYDVVRVGPEGETEILTFQDGYWRERDGTKWTDFIVAPEEVK